MRALFSVTLTALVTAVLLVGCKMNPRSAMPLPAYRPLGTARSPAIAPSEAESAGAQRIAGSLPSLDEEVWIVARTRSISAPHAEEVPGQGSLVAEEKGQRVPLPLKDTDVRATIQGCIATVSVVQQYQNPFDEMIEALYVFPLPENAAVNEFVMSIGERRIRGIIRDRAEAEAIYQAAKAQGYVASLLTEERPNIFTQSVANIEPGKQIDIQIQYFHTLAYDDGWYEFVFPMVVGPRFNPSNSLGGVGATSREQPGASGQKTEVSYLHPAERSGHDISLHVDLQAAVEIEEVACRNHQIETRAHSPTRHTIELDPADHIPNKDFVLRYRVAGDRVKAGLVTARDGRGGFFSLVLYPPAELQRAERQPLELVFVLDCSGSMSGRPIEQAKAAIRRGLELLEPGDSFQLINFSMSAGQLARNPLEATPENIARAQQFLTRLNAEGGTMMIEGIKAALNFSHDPARLRFVCFLTDGYIGNEAEILAAIGERLGASRIFSFGVGSSPNRYLMDSMARMGRGAVAYLGQKDEGAAVMAAFFERISYPALTDIQIDWNGLRVSDVFPARIPDLFMGRAVVLSGRFEGEVPDQLTIAGRAGARAVRVPLPIDPSEMPARSIASVWARTKIASLAEPTRQGDESASAAIRQLALDFNLISPDTAFVAVDSANQTAGPGTTVRQAVPVPQDVSYDNTVSKPE
jgi:Ca-activated chloride channel homolog